MSAGSPSSRDLHPRTGARFVFERDRHSRDDEPRYQVTIYLPEAGKLRATLVWVDGQATLDDRDGEAPEWTLTEAVKFARVLHRTPRAHMVRWRGPPRGV